MKDMTAAGTPGREVPGIQSVEVGAEILSAMANVGLPATLTAIATAAEMPLSKVRRYLVSFIRCGLVSQEPESGRYQFGHLGFRIGAVAFQGLDIVRKSAPLLAELRDATGETALLTVWGGRGPTIMLVEESLQPIMLNARVGSTLPVLTSATGRVYASHAMDREVLAVIEQELASLSKERTRLLLGALSLNEWLRLCREQPWIEARDEYQNGVHAFSAPVFSFRRQIAGAVTLITRSGAADDECRTSWGRAVSHYASAMSRQCGAVQQAGT